MLVWGPMSKGYIERRIIKAGIRLSERRIEQRGTPIMAADIRDLEVRTMSPAIMASYGVLGVVIMGLSLWFHFEVRNMAISVALLLVGFGNLAFAGYGKPKRVSDLEGDIDLMSVTAEIVDGFVKKMDET